MDPMKLPAAKETTSAHEQNSAGGLAETAAAIQAENAKAEAERPDITQTAASNGTTQQQQPPRVRSQVRARQRPPAEPRPKAEPEVLSGDEQLDGTMWDKLTRLELTAAWQDRYSRTVRMIALSALFLAVCILAVFVLFRFRLLPKMIDTAVTAAKVLPAAA